MVMTWSYIKAVSRLIRLPNLLIIVLTQSLIRWSLMSPLLKANGIFLQMSTSLFVALMLATLLITAGGYVINDYFDRKIDTVNNPEEVIVGRSISLRHSMTIHLVLTAIGVLLGFYVAWAIDYFVLGILFLLGSGILWFYSTTYKRQVFLGNFIVALMTAMVPMIILLFELPLQYRKYGNLLASGDFGLSYLVLWVGCFSAFAFILTLAREIIKDAEDIRGDASFGRRTLPAVVGLPVSKAIVIALYVITALSLVLIYLFYLPDRITLIYITAFLIIPLAVTVFLTLKAKDQKDFHVISILTKGIMISGLLYALAAQYIIHHYS